MDELEGAHREACRKHHDHSRDRPCACGLRGGHLGCVAPASPVQPAPHGLARRQPLKDHPGHLGSGATWIGKPAEPLEWAPPSLGWPRRSEPPHRNVHPPADALACFGFAPSSGHPRADYADYIMRFTQNREAKLRRASEEAEAQGSEGGCV